MAIERRVYALFADVLRYPTEYTAQLARECADLLSTELPEAGESLRDFSAFLGGQPFERIEELFTSSFELNPVCYPYVGYHLFGDDHKRAAFMVKAKERLTAHGIQIEEGELPDHLPLLLEFAAEVDDDEAVGSLINECLIPTVKKMAACFKTDNPYGKVIAALLQVLEQDQRKQIAIAGGAE